MKSSILVFLGLRDNGSDLNVETLKTRLQEKFSNLYQNIAYSTKSDLLIVTFTNPDFRYNIRFINKETLKDYNQLSKDFDLPWDRKPVSTDRFSKICRIIEKENWPAYHLNQDIGLIILNELENFKHIKVYCIPSM